MAAARSRLAEAYLVVPREHGSLGVSLFRASLRRKKWGVFSSEECLSIDLHGISRVAGYLTSRPRGKSL